MEIDDRAALVVAASAVAVENFDAGAEQIANSFAW